MSRCLVAALLLSLLPQVASAATSVCVEVEVRSWTQSPGEDSTAGENAGEAAGEPMAVPVDTRDPFAIDPARYLERLVRYEVTHEVGFEAVDAGCAQRIRIELYPLRMGWTVFARYTGHAREEKVDEVLLDEFSPLAQRLVRALLWDRAITQVINRENVLRADSQTDLRRIRGEGHFTLGLGTQVRAGQLATLDGGQVSDDWRILTPLSVQIGYRGKYKAWGLDVFARGALGTNKEAPRRNPAGGHVDFEYAGAAGLHFLRYLDAVGMTSWYLGGGAMFEVSGFSVIKPEGDRGNGDVDEFYTGGLNLDFVVGYEFMRTSRVHFYLQGELHVPTFQLDTEVDAGGVDTYLPGGLLQVGMVF
ncbi:MAG: hypothetical protein KC613_11950 [Myxococcales bacterium]|nr:hypothetical protein [Myxococcales bacterium]MCB9526311.1 hypothetical protein [Myxococcales bacterium]